MVVCRSSSDWCRPLRPARCHARTTEQAMRHSVWSRTRKGLTYSGRFNPRNSSIRMRSRALVVRSISSWRRRANDFIEWSSVSSSNRSSTHVSAHDRTVWTTPMSIHHRPYCPFIALHVARVRLLSVLSFSKIWAPASDTLFPVAAVRSLLRYRRLSGRIASS